jgi:hypothetical protein
MQSSSLTIVDGRKEEKCTENEFSSRTNGLTRTCLCLAYPGLQSWCLV